LIEIGNLRPVISASASENTAPVPTTILLLRVF